MIDSGTSKIIVLFHSSQGFTELDNFEFFKNINSSGHICSNNGSPCKIKDHFFKLNCLGQFIFVLLKNSKSSHCSHLQLFIKEFNFLMNKGLNLFHMQINLGLHRDFGASSSSGKVSSVTFNFSLA